MSCNPRIDDFPDDMSDHPDHPDNLRADRASDLLPCRAVWLSEDDFFDILAGGQQMQAVRQRIIDQWDAAPADPVSAVDDHVGHGDHVGYRSTARSICEAIGYPKDSP